MGTPDLAVSNLAHIVDAGFNVVGTFCQPDKPKGRKCIMTPPPMKAFATTNAIEVCQPRRLAKRAMRQLEELRPDLIVVAAYGKLLPPAMLALPRLGCVNVHASLLPRYRGAAPIQWAIANGEKVTGITIMQMDEGLDTGDIIAQEELAIGETETAESLHDRLAESGARLLVRTLPSIADGTATLTPQDEALATCAPILCRDHGRVEWKWDSKTLIDRTRGFHSWPGTHTSFKGRQLKLFPPVKPGRFPATGSPGEVLDITRDGVEVACGDGAVLLTEVQLQGKKRLPAFDFANGARLNRGVILGD